MVAYTTYAADSRVRREAETLASHGFRVVCLVNRIREEPSRFGLDGVDVVELNVPKYRGKNPAAYIASYLRFLAAATAECARMGSRGRLHVIHAHNLPDFLVFAGLLPRLRGAKVVLDVHDSIPETYATKFSRGAVGWRLLCLEEKFSAIVAHRVICVNHPQRDALVGRGIPAAKIFVSMNIADPRIFKAPDSARPAREDGSFRLVYHGTMAGRLGVDLVIRAVDRLRERIRGLELYLWGHGDDADAFRTLASRLNIANRVHFNTQGFPLEELPVRLQEMDVGVVGNRRSPAGDLMLPGKLLEYVALGIPAVVPRLRAIAYYFTDEMVSYYEPDDVDSMADAIYRLHAQLDLRREQPRRASGFLVDYGWHRQGPELVSFYRQVLES
jgi:glycosyltransferase involved in cell wall biosynthesis